tara:strand:- start:2092 stop:3003 length:912 start_codon:yes stop_codon:yes gene_type:complete
MSTPTPTSTNTTTPTVTPTNTATPTVTKTNTPTPTTSRSGLGEIYMQAYNDVYPGDGTVDNAYIVIGRDADGKAIVKTARQVFPSPTPTNTATQTPTNTETPTQTPTNTITPTQTITNTQTNTVTPSVTPSPVYTTINVFNNQIETSKRIFVMKQKSLQFNFTSAIAPTAPNGGRLHSFEIGEVFLNSSYKEDLIVDVEVFSQNDGSLFGQARNVKLTKGALNQDGSIKLIATITSGVDIDIVSSTNYVLRMSHVEFPFFYGIKTGESNQYYAGVVDEGYNGLLSVLNNNQSTKLKVNIGAYV